MNEQIYIKLQELLELARELIESGEYSKEDIISEIESAI